MDVHELLKSNKMTIVYYTMYDITINLTEEANIIRQQLTSILWEILKAKSLTSTTIVVIWFSSATENLCMHIAHWLEHSISQ